MKLIREHINEKFKKDTDPIEDMGIGKVPYHYNNLYIAKHDIEYVSDDHKKVKVPKGTIIIAQGGGYYGTFEEDISLGNIYKINGKSVRNYEIRQDKNNYKEIYYDVWEKALDLVKEVEYWFRNMADVKTAAETGNIENVYNAIDHQHDVIEEIKKLLK